MAKSHSKNGGLGRHLPLYLGIVRATSAEMDALQAARANVRTLLFRHAMGD